jgi:hypothetical protein
MRLLNCGTGFCGTKPDNFLIEEPGTGRNRD